MQEKVEDGNEENGEDHIPVCKSFPWGCRIPARVVLGILSFFAFFTNYMLRVNLNIAIVSMVKTDTKIAVNYSSFNNFTSENEVPNINNGICFHKTKIATNENNSNSRTLLQDEGETFAWDSVDQGIILGSFYWTYVMSLVPGAMLARRFGGKLIYGMANLVSAIFTLLTPFAARNSFSLLLVVRVVEGLFSGTTWPAMHTLASQWIPPQERSKFVTTYMGNAVGTAFTYPLCGLLIHTYGWPAAFYVPGCLTLVWCIFWWILVFDSPSLHPRISRKERNYIEDAVSPFLNKSKMAVPWLDIMKSLPFWALVMSVLATLWTFILVTTYTPTYFRTVHGFDIRANGMLSGFPNIMRFISAIIASYATDRLIKTKMYSVTLIRKVNGLIALLLPALFFLLMTNVGCSSTAEVIILAIASTLGGAISAGPLANSMDIAPNFSGIIMSLSNFLATTTGFVVPSVVGAILDNDYSKERWRIVFIITAALTTACSLFYAYFGSAEIQPWNQAMGRGEDHTKNDIKYSHVSNTEDSHISTEIEDLNHINDLFISEKLIIAERDAAGKIL